MTSPTRGAKRARAGSLGTLAAVAGIATTLATAGCRGRPRSWDVPVDYERPREGGAAVLELDLSSGTPEVVNGGLFTVPAKISFDALVSALHQAKSRRALKGVFVAFGAADLGWAQGHELGDALVGIRERSVPIICHADVWDNGAYAAAARGCDVIAMSPGGEVGALGPSATIPYAREFLVDKLKAQVDMLQIGKFKGAAEPLTRDGPSEEYRRSTETALAAITKADRDALTKRGVADLLGTGPYVGEDARVHKFIDVLMDRKAAREEAKKRGGNVPVELAFGLGSEGGAHVGVFDLLRSLTQPSGESSSRAHVRLVRLHGEITLGSEGSGLLGGRAGISARHVVERAHAIAKDTKVKAVVLRIDSPGGSALGSDLAWIALKALRDAKPVIVSIGDMAASGGYYLASAGTRVFAEPESIVGSIGVVGGKVAFGGTLAQIGIHTASFGDQRAATLGSILQPWDPATRERLLGAMTDIYNLFLDRVSEGRGKPRSAFENAVEGRVFGGDMAKDLGLIDEIGGLGSALAHAKRAGGLPDDAPVVVDESGGLIDLITGGDEARSSLALHQLEHLHHLRQGTMSFGGQPPAELVALHHWVLAFSRATRGGAVAAMMPAPLVLR